MNQGRSRSLFNQATLATTTFRTPGRLFARVRMFIGRCINSNDGAVWFTQKRENGPWYKLVSTIYVNGTQLGNMTYFENLPKISCRTGGGFELISAARFHRYQRSIKPLPPTTPNFPTSELIATVHRLAIGPCGPGRTEGRYSYLDKQTDTLLYLERDGRHLAAISPAGKILWLRNPFVDADLCPYRNEQTHYRVRWSRGRCRPRKSDC